MNSIFLLYLLALLVALTTMSCKKTPLRPDFWPRVQDIDLQEQSGGGESETEEPETEEIPAEDENQGTEKPVTLPQTNKPDPVPATTKPVPVPEKPAGLASLLTEAQFNAMFPQRISFYTYQGLVEAADATEGFAKVGSIEVKKREIAALLANGEHESDHFKAVREYNTANYDKYCDSDNTISPCVSGQQYYGRGPIQLSWNYNYGAAGKFIGVDLLRNPDLVATNAKIAWQTMLWYWMTQKGPGTMTPHAAMVNPNGTDGPGFGETIRSINGALECDGKNAAQVASRLQYYRDKLQKMGLAQGPKDGGC